MSEVITINDTLELRAVEEQHVTPLHQLVLKNKSWLQQSLNWPQFVASEEDTRKNVQGNMRATRCCTSAVTPKCS